MITDAAVAVTSGSDVNKWMGPLKEMLTLAPGVFGAEQHTSSLRDIASSVLAFLQSPHTLDKANTAILFTCLQRSFSNSRLHPQFCTERNLDFFSEILSGGDDTDVCCAALACVNNLTCCYPPGQRMLVESGLLLRFYFLVQAPNPAKVLLTLCRFLLRLSSVNGAIKSSLANVATVVWDLAGILAACVRAASPSFPCGDSRVSLATVVLQLMFALGDAFISGIDDSSRDDMTQLGLLLIDVLLLPHDIAEAVVLKRHVVHLLLYMPSPYGEFIYHAGCLRPLCDLLCDDLLVIYREEACTLPSSIDTELKCVLGVLLNVIKLPAAAVELSELLYPSAVHAEESSSSLRPSAMIRHILQHHPSEEVQFTLSEFVMQLSQGKDDVFEQRVGTGNATVRKLSALGFGL